VVSPARIAAFDVLRKVDAGGYASDLLIRAAKQLSSRDAGLAEEIVFGCLRRQAQLDFLIDQSAGRPLKLDPEVRTALRMGVYQVRHLDRVPRHAAVSESVELVKRARKRSAAALTNAVLRKVDAGPVKWPDRSIELSCPSWLLDRWTAEYGEEAAEGIARAALLQPETWVRTSAPAPNLEVTDIPGCYRLTSGAVPAGARIQDIGSQSVVPLLDLHPGQRFLDLCAAPGNKTAQALETPLDAIACDLHWSRIRGMRDVDAHRVVLDASKPLPFTRPFDRILVDAPCTGTGTLARNPEIKWRLKPDDPARLQNVQVRILANALDRLAPGGRLVYSTCSLQPEENQEVLEAVLAGKPGCRLCETRLRIPGADPGDGFFAGAVDRL
jgi:16S rRNA (cytosine967-C5)-methyltransferase